MIAEAREAVVQEAMSWRGTAYQHHARVKGVAVDCGMFLAEVYERAGVMPHCDPGEYPSDWHLHRSEERYLGIVQERAHKVDSPQPGDIALFHWGRCIAHGAIVVQWPLVIHSTFGVGVVVANVEMEERLTKTLAGFWSPWSDNG